MKRTCDTSPCSPGTSLLRSFAPFQTPCPRNPTPNALSPPPRGVFGFVKRVQHKGNQMSCAAKFIPLRSRTRVQAYRERDILAGLSHPLVTALLDQFETRKTLILILELYPVSPQGCKVAGGGGVPQAHRAPEGCVGPVVLVIPWGQPVTLAFRCFVTNPLPAPEHTA